VLATEAGLPMGEDHLGRYATGQPGYSILRRRVEADVVPVAEQYGLGVLIWSPLASGWLSGAIRAGRPVTHAPVGVPGRRST
jgi:aryl-alcohol dehydrogenase-like predicted oxidoreductase